MSFFTSFKRNVTTMKKLYLGFFMVILLMVMVSLYAYRNTLKESDALEWNIHSYKVLDESGLLLLSLLNIESGMRGFAVTGFEPFLDSMIQDNAEFKAHLDIAKSLTRDNPVQQMRLEQLQEVAQQWQAYETNLIALRREVETGKIPMSEVIHSMQTMEGKVHMSKMRRLLSEFNAEEQMLLKQRAEVLRENEHLTRWTILMGSITAAILAGLFALLITGELKDKRESQERIRKQSQMLDLSHNNIIIFTLEGCIKYWNHGAEVRYGLSKEEAIGQIINDLLQTVYPKPFKDIIEELLIKGYWEGEVIDTGKDDKTKIVQCHWTLERDSFGNPVSIFEVSYDITEQRAAEESLRQSEVRFQECIDNVHDRYTFFEAVRDESGRIVDFICQFVNRSECQAYGKEREELIGKSMLVIWPGVIGKIFDEYCQVCETGQSLIDEQFFYHDDQQQHLSGIYARQVIRLGDGVAISARDITDRKQYEEELKSLNAELESKVLERTSNLQELNAVLEEEIAERQAAEESLTENRDILAISEARYRGLFEHMHNAFTYRKVVVDDEGKPIDLIFMEANSVFEKMIGKTAVEIIGKPWTKVVPGIERDSINWIEVLGNVALTGQSTTIEGYSAISEKYYQIFAYSPAPDCVAAITVDNTDRKRAAEELKESRERYEALLKQSSEAIAVVDYDTKAVIEINEAYSRMFGYSLEEIQELGVSDFVIANLDEISTMNLDLLENGYWPAKVRHYERKNGEVIYVERIGSLIRHRGKQLILLSYRDITEQQKLQSVIQEQVELAGVVQKSLLPADYQDDKLMIKTIFQPLTLVSGDFYGYRWSRDGTQLHGYVMDVTGHGMATALHTSAISSLLNQLMENEEVWTEDIMVGLNKNLLSYFQDFTFVALIAFTLDFAKKELRCISGGINYILSSTRKQMGVVTIPGIYLGVTQAVEFETFVIPIQYGDTIYFMTDGIFERLPKEIVDNAFQFNETIQSLEGIVKDGNNHDDCSALCIQIKDEQLFPIFFEITNPSERHLVQCRINQILDQLVGEKNPKIEVALGEAIMNGAQHGKHISVKLNKIGQNIIMRVRDDGNGFPGNTVAKEFVKIGEEVFESLLYAESGRGIPLMLAWTDKLLYNRRGNEVMLIKSLG